MIENLRQEYEALVASGTIAGSGRLRDLGAQANNVVEITSGAERVIAFVLCSVFKSLAERQDGQPVTEHEGQEVYQMLHGPISRAINLLAGDLPEDDPVLVASAVIDAHVLPRIRH